MTRTVALAVAAFALTGCGSSSPSLSRLRRQATGICQRALANSDRIQPPALPSATARFLRRGADPVSAVKTLQRRLAPTESAEDAAWHTLDIPACAVR